MKEHNICKFVPASYTTDLTVACFVYETDRTVMQTESSLFNHRAMLFTKGEGTAVINGQRLPFSVGTLVFCFKGERLYVDAAESCEYLYIAFDGPRAAVLFDRFHITAQTRSFAGHDGLIPLWKESLSRASNVTIDLAAESILLYTFSRLYEHCGAQSALIARIIKLSETHFTDTSLSLATLAEEISYNPKYLSHLFKKETGIGYAEYLRTLRIRYAVSLFDNGLDSIKTWRCCRGSPIRCTFQPCSSKPSAYPRGTICKLANKKRCEDVPHSVFALAPLGMKQPLVLPGEIKSLGKEKPP